MSLIRWALPQIPTLISIQPQSTTQQAKYKSQQISDHFSQSQVAGLKNAQAGCGVNNPMLNNQKVPPARPIRCSYSRYPRFTHLKGPSEGCLWPTNAAWEILKNM